MLISYIYDTTRMARIMQGEISDNTNRARIYSVSSSMMNIPILAAPIVGAALARPVDRYSFFEDWTLFQNFPYLLPSLATGLIGYAVAFANLLFLKEVYSCCRRCFCTKSVRTADQPFQTRQIKEGPSEESSTMSTLEILRYPKVRTVLLMTTALMTLEFSWTASEYVQTVWSGS